MKKFGFNNNLKEDFEEYSKRYNQETEIVFDIRFDSNYPLSPPFFRVIRPLFDFMTAQVTSEGSICKKSIMGNEWTPDRSVESILIEILLDMKEEVARLDLNRSENDYTKEAEEFFYLDN